MSLATKSCQARVARGMFAIFFLTTACADRALTEPGTRAHPPESVADLDPPNPPKVSSRFAYVLADQPSTPLLVPYTPQAKTSYNALGQPNRVTRMGTGSYLVSLGGMGTGHIVPAHTETILVTTYGGSGARCTPASWDAFGAELLVNVFCGVDARTRLDATFTLLMLGTGSLPSPFAFALVAPNGDPFPSFSSPGVGPGSVDVAPAPAIYVLYVAPSTPPAQWTYMTSVFNMSGGPSALDRLCGLSATSTDAELFCHDAGSGANALAGFTFAYLSSGRPGRRAGFASWDTSGSTTRRYNSSGGSVTSTRVGPGQADVVFAGLGVKGVGLTAQVSAVGDVAAWCSVGYWRIVGVDLVVRVICRDWRRTLQDNSFDLVVLE